MSDSDTCSDCGQMHDIEKPCTASDIRLIVDTSGWVIELENGVWLVSADADPSRTLVLKNATRWPTERSARRAMSRVRKNCSRKFASARIYFVEGEP